MTDAAEMLRPTEAAIVSGVTLGDVHHAIDRGVLPDDLVAMDRRRWVSVAGCPFIAFYYASARRLTAEERLSAIREMGRRLRGDAAPWPWTIPAAERVVRDGFLAIDMEPFVAGTAERWRLYRAARDMVATSPDILSGTPVIRGTRIPVHDVAASVAAGHSLDRILAAYPSLTAEEIERAELYARANPPQGRPRTRPPLDDVRLVSEERVARRPAG